MKFKKLTKRRKKNLQKFKHAKFDYAKFVKNYYIEKGNAYISVKVNSIDDIVSKYSIDGYEWINSDFANYIEECAYYIPVEESIIIEICGAKFNDEEKALITKVIKEYFGLQLGDKIIDLDTNRRNSNILLGFGIIGIVALILLYIFNIIGVIEEFLGFIFWFFLWEYGDMAWIDRAQLQTEKMEAGQLSTAKIIFEEEKENK